VNGTPAEQLRELLSGAVVIVGIGNAMLGDDGAGPRVIELLRAAGDTRTLIDAGSAPERHFGEIEAAQPGAVVLIDAVDFGAAAGAVTFFDAASLPRRASSTHDVSLRLVMEYLQMVTGAKVCLVGIQPEQTAFGAGLSTPVEDAARGLAGALGAHESVSSGRAVAGTGVSAWTNS
jgi:hydrogenase 3 maturation protease